MERIVVKFGYPLSQAVGARRLDLEMPALSTVATLLQELARHYPEFEAEFQGEGLGRPSPYIFFLNSRPVTSANYESTYLQDGDVVHIVLPVVGG